MGGRYDDHRDAQRRGSGAAPAAIPARPAPDEPAEYRGQRRAEQHGAGEVDGLFAVGARLGEQPLREHPGHRREHGGTAVDATGACRSCGTTPGPADLEIRAGPSMAVRRDDPLSRALRQPHRLRTPLPAA